MAKSQKFGTKTSGNVLAIRQHEEGACFIGYPNRMFKFVPDSPSEFRRACILFRIDDATLTKFVEEANQHPNKFVFMTL